MAALSEAQYEPIPEAGCWLWLGGTKNGYGAVSQGRGKTYLYAHRASYEQHIGPIADGENVLHRCDTPLCVNPDHLFLGSHADNMRDKTLKGRAAKKLTPEQVSEIRSAEGSHRAIAKQYGVTHVMIGKIKRNEFWKWSE